MDALHQEMETLVGLIQNGITTNARVAIDQDEYNARYQALTDRYQAFKTKYDAIAAQVEERKNKAEALQQFIARLEKTDIIPVEFDDGFWSATVQYVTIYSKEDIRFTFKDGTEIRV